MHIHILGICGTFMGGLALLARAAGHTVTGCDANVYPPMSTQLREQGITLIEGYSADQADNNADMFIIGNAISRGNVLLECILERNLRYISGPQWLAENILQDRWVLAVAGTHGKTTTASMLAWVLEEANLAPGFLIGGVPTDFGVSARLGKTPFFVIEADEYDTAFCDKRSKFIHYHPRTLVINNLEFDHADIFPDLAAIETQFHHLIRTIPSGGLVIAAAQQAAIDRVLARGLWSELLRFNEDSDWQTTIESDQVNFTHLGHNLGTTQLALPGAHNRANALAAMLAARHVGVAPEHAIAALGRFSGIARRLQVYGHIDNITLYDDFAHHPTAIHATLTAVRERLNQKQQSARIIAILEPRSNTMKLGSLSGQLAHSLSSAEAIWCYCHQLQWDAASALAPLGEKAHCSEDLTSLIAQVVDFARAGDHIIIMSNGGFNGIHQKLLDALSKRQRNA